MSTLWNIRSQNSQLGCQGLFDNFWHFWPFLTIFVLFFRLLSIGVINGSLPTREVYQYHRWIGRKKEEKNLPPYSIFSLPLKKISSHGMKNLLIPDDNKFVPIADKKKFFSPKQSQSVRPKLSAILMYIKIFLPQTTKIYKKLLFSKNKIV